MSALFLASNVVQTTSESQLVMLLVQLIVIITAARLFGWLFRRIGQPAVVGETAAGLILGPSVFGKLEALAGWPHHEISHAIFDPAIAPTFQVLSQLGLILLLFLVGLEFEIGHIRSSSKSAVGISLAGLILPFAMGWGLAHWIHPFVEGIEGADGIVHSVDLEGFALFMGTAMSITALPVLGRMMLEFGITKTRIGTVTLTAAALDDAIGWIILAGVSAMVRARYDVMETLKMAGMTAAYAIAMIFVARPLLKRWTASMLRRDGGRLNLNAMAVLLVVIFLAAIATSLIGIFAIFGAFVLGAVLSDQHEFRETVTRQLRNFVTVFFLPIFFTYTGLRTDIGSLSTPGMWAVCAMLIGVAVAGKFGGCATAARLGGFNWRESSCIGVMMNTRGLMELVVINVGHELGIIPRSVFCMLVLMAIVTTFMTTPFLLWWKRGTELEAAILQSDFAMGRRAIETPQ